MEEIFEDLYNDPCDDSYDDPYFDPTEDTKKPESEFPENENFVELYILPDPEEFEI